MSDIPPLDFSRIPFPSDNVPIGTLRAKYPEETADTESTFREIQGTMALERWLAQRAYVMAFGRPDPYKGSAIRGDREELIDSLVIDYQEYGLSAGPMQTREMVKNFEEAARMQAREHIPKGR